MVQTTKVLSKDFSFVAIGQIISLFGNQILRYALPLYLLNQTGSSALFGTVSACAFIPMLILFPIGGMIADRVNKKSIMVILDFFTSILVLLFCFLGGKVDMIPLMAVTIIILYGIQGLYQPAVNASIPILVDQEYIMQANSIVDVISSLANMLGPVIGGILFSMMGLKPILIVSMICFFLSAVMETFIHIPYEKRQREKSIVSTAIQDIKGSFRFMFKENPALWKMSVIYGSVCLFLSSLVVISVPVIITQHLGFSINTANQLFGYAQGVIAVGSILGGLFAGILSKKLKPKLIPCFIAACSLSVIIGGIALQRLNNPVEVYIVLVISCGLLLTLSSLVQIQMLSYVQILTPNDQIGKVISCVICICMCANPIGSFFYGIIFEKIGKLLYLPFYIAPLIVLGISILSYPVFYQINTQIEEKEN